MNQTYTRVRFYPRSPSTIDYYQGINCTVGGKKGRKQVYFRFFLFNFLAKCRRDAVPLTNTAPSTRKKSFKSDETRSNANHVVEEFARVTRLQLRQPGVFQFRAEMFVRRADKITRENSREERACYRHQFRNIENLGV